MPLSPKAFQLLELLLDRRPEAVAKSELLERLWPETFVSDASLHNLVAEIRAGGRDTSEPSPIRLRVPWRCAGRRPPSTLPEGRRGPASRLEERRVAAVRRSEPGGPRSRLRRPHRFGTLSRRHARIVVTGREAAVEDLGSKNGTLVNGQRVVEPVVLKDSDEIEVGSLTMTYRIMDSGSSTITRREYEGRSWSPPRGVGGTLRRRPAAGTVHTVPYATPQVPAGWPRLRGRVRRGRRRRLREVGLRAWLHPQQREAVLHVAPRTCALKAEVW